MFTYNLLKYLDHKIHSMLVFFSFYFHLLRELHVKLFEVSKF
jgi:hypothetical protein